MRWDDSGHRFARPVRWYCEKLDGETLAGSGTSFGHRFTHGEARRSPSAQEYADTLRAANVEPDSAERRRLIVGGARRARRVAGPRSASSRRSCTWSSGRSSSSRSSTSGSCALPERVIVTAMQSHQRYFPLGGNRFAVVAAGGDVEVTRPGYTRVLDARLEDAAFTFDRDVAVGIEELARRLGRDHVHRRRRHVRRQGGKACRACRAAGRRRRRA